MSRIAAVVSIALVLAAACALPTAGEFATGKEDIGPGLPEGGAALPDASVATSDSATKSDAGADAATMPPAGVDNLLPPEISAYEVGTDCGGAGGYQATLETSSAPHAGGHSCNVCRAPGQESTDIWSIDLGFEEAAQLGSVYHASAWVRRPPGSTDAIQLGLVLRTWTNNYDTIETLEGPDVVLTDDWQQLLVEMPITKKAPKFDTYLYTVNKPGLGTPCFLVDDFFVWRTP